ncbi:MAG TPA: NAD(P)/FAD-dependent oxidoreductase [Bacillota bacterium]|nr:NAD(P)/FAD-dependent oxidoreductase [Bacillota bacterium]
MTKDKRHIVVIGGGPAGMMAAAVAGSRGLDVTLIEKNEKLGKKLYMTGKGRCNVTNNADDVEDLIANIPTNGKFLYSALYTFTNKALIGLLNSLGLKTKVERGNRVFPVSDKSSDVIRTLQAYMRKNEVKIRQAEAEKIIADDGGVQGIQLKGGDFLSCQGIILATGGLSYPTTGSTGDGFRMARGLGHTITPLRPSLVPIETVESWPKDAQGLSLRNISVKVTDKVGRKLYEDFGEMIFTHYGVSGPIILSASSYMGKADPSSCQLEIDLKPALTEEKLDLRLQRDFKKHSRKNFSNSLDDLLPQKLIPIVINLSQIRPEKPVNQISKEDRHKLVKLLKGLTLTIRGYRPISEAIVTSGGVSTKEIDPSTMESKLLAGLYFAGEVIDVDAYTGGFNMQIAFSTGYLAGQSC